MSTGAAIVGTGFMGQVHAEALARIGVPVLGIVGSTPERAAAARLGPPYRSFADMLDDDRVDAVTFVPRTTSTTSSRSRRADSVAGVAGS